LEYNQRMATNRQVSKLDEVGRQWEGQTLNGEFPLRRYLGGSDHSAVFLTERGGSQPQRAAIKLILTSAQHAETQLDRLRASAMLSHPHVLQIFQVGQCQMGGTKLLYAVTEYADENLSQVLPVRSLTPAETRDVLVPVVNVLTYLHGRGLVHGGLKPRNIMAIRDQLKVSTDRIYRQRESTLGRSETT